jgi:hypothetical protein
MKTLREINAALEEAFKDVRLESFLLMTMDDGEKVYDTEAIIAYLLFEGVLFPNTRDFSGPYNAGTTAVLFVNCNDLLCPAADAECVKDSELPELCRLYTEEESGILKWVAKKRGVPAVRWNHGKVK